jgi:hypothetical protein
LRQQHNTTVDKAFEEVRQILREVLGSQEVVVYLFGSWARGESTSLSDIDIALDSTAPLAPGVLAQLRERLEESHVPYRVDVVDLTSADAAFRQQVLDEGVRWSV